MKLSNQAQWYLRGSFPVYERPCVGHASVEPKAMQELVDNGLAVFKTHPLLGNYWNLTAAGSTEKNLLEYPRITWGKPIEPGEPGSAYAPKKMD